MPVKFSFAGLVRLIVLLTLFLPGGAASREPAVGPATEESESAQVRGFRFLTEKAYLPADFTETTFAEVWRSWPEELQRQAASLGNEERRQLAFERYGLTTLKAARQTVGIESSGKEVTDKPLQYVVDEAGNWTMNCFACHGGTVYGQPYPGAPNNRYALETLTEEIRRTKLRQGDSLTRMDIGSLLMPLGSTVGRTNAVMFGVGLMHFRKPDLSIEEKLGPPSFVHHDMDAPPWWHFHRRAHLYIDGFATRGHRGLMQFMLVRENGPEKFREWEADFRDVYAYLMSLRPPRYPGPIDELLASRGEVVFRENCARCHGTYGDGSPFPGTVVPLSEVGTDPVRLSALPVAGREKYASSWFAHFGEPDQQQTTVDPQGYVAPPLDGVWASAPYFHNGSVPTLWHVLSPQERPQVWRRVGEAMDAERVGLQIEVVERVPLLESDVAKRREYWDSRQFGKSNQGHDFGELLSVQERREVLEYLKTL
jgi:mono/diheme cytochrome c family protein